MSRVRAYDTAAAVAAGSTTALAVVEGVLDRIAALDPVVNAFTAVFADAARADARALDAEIAAGMAPGVLVGVPFAVKNLFDVAGVTTLAGSKVRANAAPASQDAELVARMKAAGAILVGALNMDEFAYGFATQNAHHGPTRNPHDLDRIAGGSSGGSAAAVAAGMVPLTLGSDTNGSIRVPAALCGVFGLKPTAGRLSVEGMFPFAESLDHAGVFAATVTDLALAYRALLSPPAEHRPVPLRDGGETLRVGLLGGWFERDAEVSVRVAVERVAQALIAERGIELAGAEAARSAAFALTASEGGRLHLSELRRRAHDYDPAVRDRLIAGALLPDGVAQAAQALRTRFRYEALALFERFDLLLAPATPWVAPRVDAPQATIDGRPVSVRAALGLYTQPLSFIGLPVLCAPIAGAGPLPIGVQLIARPGDEERLLGVAAELEARGILAAEPPLGFE